MIRTPRRCCARSPVPYARTCRGTGGGPMRLAEGSSCGADHLDRRRAGVASSPPAASGDCGRCSGPPAPTPVPQQRSGAARQARPRSRCRRRRGDPQQPVWRWPRRRCWVLDRDAALLCTWCHECWDWAYMRFDLDERQWLMSLAGRPLVIGGWLGHQGPDGTERTARSFSNHPPKLLVCDSRDQLAPGPEQHQTARL
jgi:hypothetical protein